MTEYQQVCRNCVGPRIVALADAERFESASRRALILDKQSTEKWERQRIAHTYMVKADIARGRAETVESSKACVLCGGSGTVTGNGSAELGGGANASLPFVRERIG